MKNYFSKIFGTCRIIDAYEYARNKSWHDVKQEDNFMIVTDDNGNYFARIIEDNFIENY